MTVTQFYFFVFCLVCVCVGVGGGRERGEGRREVGGLVGGKVKVHLCSFKDLGL